MHERIRFTESLDLDMNDEHWHCHDCGTSLISARENYKRGCLVAERMPEEIHNPVIQGEYTFAPDKDWVRILEFYCPECARQIVEAIEKNRTEANVGQVKLLQMVHSISPALARRIMLRF